MKINRNILDKITEEQAAAGVLPGDNKIIRRLEEKIGFDFEELTDDFKFEIKGAGCYFLMDDQGMVKKLGLRRRQIEEIPEEVFLFKKLETLDITWSSIHKLPIEHKFQIVKEWSYY